MTVARAPRHVAEMTGHAERSTEVTTASSVPIGLYAHVPFCRTKCTYCDFTAFAGLNHRADAYLDALEREAETRAGQIRRPVATIFFGGGTPSELTPAQLRRCLRIVRARFSPSAEHSDLSAACHPECHPMELEANPETLDPERLAVMREEGVTRLSIGVQSFEDSELKAIARFHGGRGAIEAFEAARRWGFDSISLDLMLGIPGQTVESWRRTLDRAIALAPDHVSVYGLTLEPATPLARQVLRGRVAVPDDDEQASMYALACERLRAAGYRHYEVSNWARAGHESAHNWGYWRGEDYLGIGAGATSTIGGRRWTNDRSLERYIRAASGNGVAEWDVAKLSPDEALEEMAMLGLRTAAGVSTTEFEHRFGQSLAAWGGSRLQELVGTGLLRWSDEHLVIPEDRWFVMHGIVAALLAED